MTNQQTADALLQQWQSLRDLPPESRIEALMADYFLPPPETDILYEITLRNIAREMADA